MRIIFKALLLNERVSSHQRVKKRFLGSFIRLGRRWLVFNCLFLGRVMIRVSVTIRLGLSSLTCISESAIRERVVILCGDVLLGVERVIAKGYFIIVGIKGRIISYDIEGIASSGA